ncbi:isochorismatase family protein, partial [Bacteroidales bacterium AH-315-N07]|nr:isochorismatase family protein [Bacteroidales bacterium AH-315-N07]
VRELYLTGLATDYCVKASAIDSVKNDYSTYVVTDAVAAVNINSEDGKNALDEMKDAGIQIIVSEDI